MKKEKQQNHADRGHAEFSPSSLKYVALCPAYHGKDGTSPAAEMGTRIHMALEVRDPSALHNEEEVEIYDEIVQMEKEFMSNFGEIEEEHDEIQVEVALNGTSTWGTCDRFLIIKGGIQAVMADYKTGISIIDPPDKNWQARAYTIGAFQKYPKIETITFAFYVPKHNATLHHTFSRNDLADMVEELSGIIKAGEATRPKWESGAPELDDCTPTQHCRFCRYEDKCPALGYLVLDVAKKLDTTLKDIDPNDLDNPARMGELFNIAKIVENWAGEIKAKALADLREGKEIAGLKLRSMGRTRRIDDNETFLNIVDNFGIPRAEITDLVNFPLAKIAKHIGAQAPKNERKETIDNFLAECDDAGIVLTSDERHSVQVNN